MPEITKTAGKSRAKAVPAIPLVSSRSDDKKRTALRQRLRQGTDGFNFDALLEGVSTLDETIVPAPESSLQTGADASRFEGLLDETIAPAPESSVEQASLPTAPLCNSKEPDYRLLYDVLDPPKPQHEVVAVALQPAVSQVESPQATDIEEEQIGGRNRGGRVSRVESPQATDIPAASPLFHGYDAGRKRVQAPKQPDSPAGSARLGAARSFRREIHHVGLGVVLLCVTVVVGLAALMGMPWWVDVPYVVTQYPAVSKSHAAKAAPTHKKAHTLRGSGHADRHRHKHR
jgi:hypothetical protein